MPPRPLRIALGPEERDLLMRIARGEPLRPVLEQLVALIESLNEGALGSVLLLDRDGVHVRHGAAPHLPIAFMRAIDGAAIGPQEGSCGAAAYLKQRVIVDDIATHPNWARYRHFTLPYGLRACWSTPILASNGDVLGTFAIYYREPRAPTDEELARLDVATHLASIAMERARVEADLRASEQRYRQIYETVSDVIFHVHIEPDGRFRFAAINPAFSVATGLSTESVVGRFVDEVVPAAAHELVFGAYRTAIEQRRTVSWEEVSDYPSGRKHGHVQISPMFNTEGRATHLVGTVHDVTAYKLAAEKIAAQAALLDKAHEAIMVLGLDETVRYWNEGAHRLYGVRGEEALGRPLSSLVEFDPGPASVLRERVLREGEASGELRRKTRSGDERTVVSSATLMRDDHGAPAATLLIETDVTEHRKLEAEFQRSQRIESLGTLAGGIAHDFNNILTGILAHVDAALQSHASDPRVHRALEEIESASWRAAELTRRILTFSRKSESSQAPIDLRVPLTEALALLRATVLPPTAIRSHFSAEAPPVLGDATAVHQIVMNLGTNAAHAIGQHAGHIDVELSAYDCSAPRSLTLGALRPGRYALITVRDDGPGMEPAIKQRIFEPFFTTKAERGTGLGLSVVHGIVSSHEGALEVESEPGRGTTFRVFLRAIEAGARVERRSDPPSHEEPRGQGELVLFVDDEETIVALARELLPARGYRVAGYSDPVAALRAFTSDAGAFAALVTDSAMHGMTGFELAQAVRQIRPQLAIVVSSSESQEGRKQFEALGACEVLPKPVRFHRIAAAIDQALGHASA